MKSIASPLDQSNLVVQGFQCTVREPAFDIGHDAIQVLTNRSSHLRHGSQFLITEKLLRRKGKMQNLVNHGTGRVRMELSLPSRSLLGYRDEFLTDTKGTGILSSYFAGYEEHRGDFPSRYSGSMVSDRAGEAVGYAIFHLEPRGTLFVSPGDVVYEGMIVGEHSRENDLNVNPCKEKKQTNMRAAGRDENIILTPSRKITLEAAMQYIKSDEMVEVTPKSIRLRKAILSQQLRSAIKPPRKVKVSS